MLAAECLFIDVSEIVQADTILETAIAKAPPGPARAEALSLRAIIRYYHGQTPDAVRLGEQALAEAGSDPLLRAKVLGRAAFLVMQVDLERGNGLAAEAIELLEGPGARRTSERSRPRPARERPAAARQLGARSRARPAHRRDRARRRR